MKRAQAGAEATGSCVAHLSSQCWEPHPWLPPVGNPTSPQRDLVRREQTLPSACTWAGGITPGMGTGVGSCFLNVSRMATLSEGGNQSFTHLFSKQLLWPGVQVTHRRIPAHGQGHLDSFWSDEVSVQAHRRFPEPTLGISRTFFFISTEISPDTLPKFQLIITPHLSSVHCCSLRGTQKYLLLLNK